MQAAFQQRRKTLANALMGPALLTLTFYLWDAFHAASPSRRRDVRWLWQTLLLAVLGIAVVGLNLLIRE